MKYLLVLFIMVFTSCARKTTEVSGKFELPEGLRDCKVYTMQSGEILEDIVTVVRCPLSQTSVVYQVGKTRQTAVTVEIDTAGLGEYTRLKKKFGE